MRIGHGYDIHQFVTGKPLVLAGVTIPHSHGMLAHSDGDVVIHAICDAFLGALALGDIGMMFPDTDPKYKNVDSQLLLKKTYQVIQQNQYCLVNIDVSVIAQVPKLAPHIMKMRENLARQLDVNINAISIKARTNERLDSVGDEKAIVVHAVVLLSTMR